MKQITRYILALAAVLLFTSEVMANNTATVIKKIDGAAAGTTDPGTVAYSNGTITVTPTYGYYLTAADLTVVKTLDSQHADARRRSPGINNTVSVTASDASADPSKVTTYTFSVTDTNYDYEITANFHSRTDISGATVTVAAGSYTYNGSAQKPDVTVVLGAATLTKGTDFDVYYADSINAGTGKITIVGTRTYMGTKTGTQFTINKAAGSISYANATVDKTLIEAPFTNNLTITGDGTVTYGSSNTAVAAVDAAGEVTIKGIGQAIITATVADGTNYTYTPNTATYTLNVTTATLEVTVSGYNGFYDGAAHGITVTAPAGATVKYGTTDGVYDLDASPTYTDNGTYIVYYQVTKPNYTTVTGSATVTITRGDAKVYYKDYQFTAKIGQPFTPPQVTVEPAGLPLTFASSDTDVATVDPLTGEVTLVAPGKVEIYANFDGNANCNPASDYYVLTVLQRDIDPIDEDVTIVWKDEDFFYINDEGEREEIKLTNTVIYDILFTLNISGDPSESDGYDETEKGIVLNTPMSLRDVYYAITTGHEPGSEEYPEEFTGLTFKVPAGTGYVIIDSRTDGKHQMMVNIGSLPPVAINHKDRDKDSIFYECSEPTWVYVYNGGEVSSARMNTIPRAKKTKTHVVIYSVTRTTQKNVAGIEQINIDAFDETERWYDLQGNRINRPTKKGVYILGGQKVIVQ